MTQVFNANIIQVFTSRCPRKPFIPSIRVRQPHLPLVDMLARFAQPWLAPIALEPWGLSVAEPYYWVQQPYLPLVGETALLAQLDLPLFHQNPMLFQLPNPFIGSATLLSPYFIGFSCFFCCRTLRLGSATYFWPFYTRCPCCFICRTLSLGSATLLSPYFIGFSCCLICRTLLLGSATLLSPYFIGFSCFFCCRTLRLGSATWLCPFYTTFSCCFSCRTILLGSATLLSPYFMGLSCCFSCRTLSLGSATLLSPYFIGFPCCVCCRTLLLGSAVLFRRTPFIVPLANPLATLSQRRFQPHFRSIPAAMEQVQTWYNSEVIDGDWFSLQILSWLCRKGEETLRRYQVTPADSLASAQRQEQEFQRFLTLAHVSHPSSSSSFIIIHLLVILLAISNDILLVKLSSLNLVAFNFPPLDGFTAGCFQHVVPIFAARWHLVTVSTTRWCVINT